MDKSANQPKLQEDPDCCHLWRLVFLLLTVYDADWEQQGYSLNWESIFKSVAHSNPANEIVGNNFGTIFFYHRKCDFTWSTQQVPTSAISNYNKWWEDALCNHSKTLIIDIKYFKGIIYTDDDLNGYHSCLAALGLLLIMDPFFIYIYLLHQCVGDLQWLFFPQSIMLFD